MRLAEWHVYISSIERHILTLNAFTHSTSALGGEQYNGTDTTPTPTALAAPLTCYHTAPHHPSALPPSQPLSQSLLFSHEVGGEHDGPALLVLGEEVPGGPAGVGVHP